MARLWGAVHGAQEAWAAGQVMRPASCERGRAGTVALCPGGSDGDGAPERAGPGRGPGAALHGPGERAGAHSPHGLDVLGKVPLRRGL